MSKKILAIETSCDETSVSVVDGRKVISNVIYSQLDLHKRYGGVVPSIARTAHQEKIDEVLQQSIDQASLPLAELDAVAVTYGPGLAIALEVGILKAKNLASELKVPLIAVNHMEGHLLSVLAGDSVVEDYQFPVLGLLVSGGHTEFVLVNNIGDYRKIGQTLDDACGEAFDKAANMLGIGYPGGPVISKLAQQARDEGSLKAQVIRDQSSLYVIGMADEMEKYRLPIPMSSSGDLNMSYSGLKTALKALVNNLSGNREVGANIRQTGEAESLDEAQKQELALMFEEAATEHIVNKLKLALKRYPDIKEVWMGGGVVANRVLVGKVKALLGEGLVLRVPSTPDLITDNAGMIGIAASFILDRVEEGESLSEVFLQSNEFEKLDRTPALSL